MPIQHLMYLGMAVYAILIYVLLIIAVTNGVWLGAVVAAWCASPVVIYVLRTTLEGGQPAGLMNLNTQSWSFLLGDTLILPFVFTMAAIGWGRMDVAGRWYTQTWWFAVAFIAGVVAGVVFHVHDIDAYTKAGAAQALLAPTKLAHDFIAYPILFGGLLALVPHVVIDSFWRLHGFWRFYGFFALIGIALWCACVWHDAGASLNPFNLHPVWNAVTFQPIS